MTLTDKEYQAMRDASFAVIREIGVETGGSNIQFAVDPQTGRMVVIEMNPRVSRSSALASKATGFPIAKIAAKLAVGYTLDELRNDITRADPGVLRADHRLRGDEDPALHLREVSRRGPDAHLGHEVRRRGHGDRPHLQGVDAEGLRSLETGARGFGGGGRLGGDERPDDADIKTKLGTPNAERIYYIRHAFSAGYTVDADLRADQDRPLVPHQLRGDLTRLEEVARGPGRCATIPTRPLRRAKQFGFSDAQLAHVLKSDPRRCALSGKSAGIRTTFRLVDTCAAEFEAFTPYYYSSYGDENEIIPSSQARRS